jgi:hypothetical protein
MIYRIYDHETLTTLIADEYGELYLSIPEDAEWEESPPLDEAMANVRKHRNALLYMCDWTQLPDAPLSAHERAVWAQYRQTLRDLPQSVIWNETQWPEPPFSIQAI